jgi:hypothetical protein
MMVNAPILRLPPFAHNGRGFYPYPGVWIDQAAESSKLFYYAPPTQLRFYAPTVVGAPYTNPEYPATTGLDGSAAVTGRAFYGFPVFDMKPELQHSRGWPDAYAIFKGNDALMQVIPSNGAIRDLTTRMNVYAIQYASTYRVEDLRPIQTWQDVTAEFFNGNTTTAITTPIPSAFRYWALRFVFDVLGGDPFPELFAESQVM